MIKWITKKRIGPFSVLPGDQIILRFDGEPVLTHEVEDRGTIDQVAIIKVEDALGFEYGIGGIFGKEKEWANSLHP